MMAGIYVSGCMIYCCTVIQLGEIGAALIQ
jgi:hypothetical protein